ncbi:hypothetical protein ACWCOW_35210 [Streptomyces sp. NPDC001939]
MEILLIACMLAWAAGAQSEQSRLGLSPAQRAVMREKTRHEKAVQKIAEKYGGASPPGEGVSPWKEPPVSLPAAFGTGYRNRRPAGHERPPVGQRAGEWAAQGVTWAQDAGRGAWQAYRKRRREAGHDDPGMVLVPMPPVTPPPVPPVPTAPPTVGATHVTKGAKAAPDATGEPTPAATTEPDGSAEPKPVAPDTDATTAEREAPKTEPEAEAPKTTDSAEPTTATEGVGRMAAEVTYESVADESDELSIMCDDDSRVYDRIRERAEREIGRGDDLIAKLAAAGFGPKVIGWVARCKEQYQVIHGQLDELQRNTVAQGDQVVKAKALLEAGQGVYAGIAKDMESVADRESYVSDRVDAEDTSAHTEIYETKAAA